MRKIIIIAVLLSAALQQSLGQAHIQTAWNYQVTTATSISQAFGIASTSGNLIVVHLDWDGQTRHISGVTDNKGNSYKKINGSTNWNCANYRAELWYAYNITGGAILTVKATLNGAPTTYSQMYISEYSGIATSIDPLDQNSVAIGTATAINSGAMTTTYTNELVYGASIGASASISKGAGFTSRSTANANIVEDKNVASIGKDSTTFVGAGVGDWVAQMATFISTISLLPVDFMSFTGHCNNNQVILNWSTGSEINNDHFTVQRSADGTNWEDLGTVKGAGNSSLVQDYSYTVAAANEPVTYFRLRQTDLDGRSLYSNVIGVNTIQQETSVVKLYPNPSRGSSLSGKTGLSSNETVTIEIYDAVGRMISRTAVYQSTFTINFPQPLTEGIYYARVGTTGGVSVHPFLVKR
jgi:hypothetical protein